ncbi:MAG: SpoIID/LytB domain-containing protein [Candidatus Kerfeldbacteria bacterium]
MNSNGYPTRYNAATRFVLLCALGCFLFTVNSGYALAATQKAVKKPTFDDKALLMNQTARYIVLPPNKAVTVWFDFKNTGTSTWTNQDPHPVSLNTDNPFNKRKSKFEVPQWRASWRPARLQQKKVKPGEIGRFKFVLKAPKKNPGIWRESFALVRDKDTRIPGGKVEFIVVVGVKPDLDVIYHAKPMNPTLSYWVRPGERIYQPVYYKNDGRASWRNEGWGVTTITHVTSETILSATSVETETSLVPGAIEKPTMRNEKATAILDFIAAAIPGTYLETFALNGPYGTIAGSTVNVMVTVSNEPKPPLDAEPIVRVGIYAPVRPVVVTANGPHEIRNAATNELIVSQAAATESTTTYSATTGLYTVALQPESKTVAAPVRFIPLSADTIMEVRSYNNKRNTTIDGIATTVNDNKFRGVIEVNYASATSKLWVINELPVEQYIKGLGETGSKSPIEFAKALITSARTYALFHTFYQAKHRAENYYINSSTDQIYRGYNYEIQTPNITQAANETRGIVITHPSMIDEKNITGVIVAAYSSCTDGRTRSYEERWGGPPDKYPYLLSVPDPNGICTNPVWLAGEGGNHMVGMSAVGALNTIVQQGLTYDAILKYYYTGVSLIKAYL